MFICSRMHCCKLVLSYVLADTNLKERSEKDVNSLIQESKFECARRKCDNETIRGKTSSHLKDIQFRLGKLIPVQFNLLEGKDLAKL